MKRSTKEINALMIDHLTKERQRIEDASDLRIDCDLKLTYNYITDEIARLNLELFQEKYQQYQENLNRVLKAGSRRGEENDIS